MDNIEAIITGTTGMVGEGVLHECLQDPRVQKVLVINRKPCGITHSKLKELIHQDFFDLTAIKDQLTGYNACLFCLGITSVGVSKEDYYKMTYTLTMQVATTLSQLNSDLVFCYVSGAGTDSTEKGRISWARVKGKTENDLQRLPFKKVYNFRPGFLKPTAGLKYAHSFYKYIGWLFPIGRAVYPGGFCTLEELGLAMLTVVSQGYKKSWIEGKEIIELAKQPA